MKYICPKCKRVSVDGNIWCQEKYCPAENSLEIFNNGEWFGNIEIIEVFSILRSSILYRAVREGQNIILKIANEGCEERLKREARLLNFLNEKSQHPMLPILLSAHEQALVKEYPYSKLVINGKTRYYEIFENVEGETLRNLLIKNPQPWYKHVGWIMISLCDVLLLIHRSNHLHLCINPETVILRFDKENIPRPVLIDLGIADKAENIQSSWDERFTFPSYTAPELINLEGKVGAATDVYGLGLLLYEMLSGQPAYPFELRKDEEIYQSIQSGVFSQTGRTDLINIPQIAESTIQKDYDLRPKDIRTLALKLMENFSSVPKEKVKRKFNWQLFSIVIGVLLAISLLLVLALIIAESA